MLRFIKYFFVFIVLYHIISTLFIYGLLDGQFNNWFAFSKDFIWISFVLLLVITNFRQFLSFCKKYYIIVILFLLFIAWSVWISFINDKAMVDIVIGFKYDIYFIFVILSAIFVGYIIGFKKNSLKLKEFFDWLFNFIFVVIVAGLLWQLLKFGFKDLFFKIGYGPIGDYIAGQNPPIYYRSGPGGSPRLGGIFAGPNNYGYFLVLFFPFFIHKIAILRKSSTECWRKFVYSLLYIVSSFLTISRGVIVSISLQIGLILKDKIFNKKFILYTIFSFVLLIGIAGFFSYFKGGSTLAHFTQTSKGVEYILKNPLGYGLGTSGPAIHYNGYILPENTYMQIIIDTGIIGFIFVVMIFGIIFYNIRKTLFIDSLEENHDLSLILKFLTIGIIGLLFEGLFLHVFEDSMVNYLFFVSWGVLIGYFSIVSENGK